LDKIKYVFNGKFEFDESSFEDSWKEYISEVKDNHKNKYDKNKFNKIKKILLSIEKKIKTMEHPK